MSTPPARIADPAYRLLRAVEDQHWWFDGMERITAAVLVEAGIRPRDAGAAGRRVLDAGCGTGRNLLFLGRYGNVTGLDHSATALACCRERGCTGLLRGSVNALPLAAECFDLVASFDVLATAGVDARLALGEFTRVLAPGGHLFVRVAAYDWLRSAHDREWAIVHRFNRRELRREIEDAGLRVRLASYANMWLLPAALLKRLAERRTPDGESGDLAVAAGASFQGRIMRAVLASEAPLIARGGLPCGLSVLALAQKPPVG